MNEGVQIPYLPMSLFLVSEKDLQAMHQAAVEMIATIGLDVQNDDWRVELEQAGAQLSATRVMFSPEMVEEFLREWRELFHLAGPGWGTSPESQPRPEQISGSAFVWHMKHIDLATDEIHPLSTQDLIRCTQFINNFEKENIHPIAPGVPQDVSGYLRPIAQYKIGAQYSPAGGAFMWTHPPATAEYLLRMADVMGKPIEWLDIRNATPLRLSADELEVALAFPNQFKGISVNTYVVAGAVGPVYPKAAAALGIAENIAAAMATRIITGLPVDWSMRVDAFDLRTTGTIYGSPEMVLFHRMSDQVNAWYRGKFPLGGSGSLMTMAKQPGIQAAADKTASGSYAIAYGCNHLTGLGSICAGEVFSPEQFVIDLEIRDWCQRLAKGVDVPSEKPEQWVEIVRQGVQMGNFLISDETLDYYQDVYWQPKLFDHSLLSSWLRQPPAKDVREQAKHIAQERLTDHPYRLAELQWSQLEEIYEEATKKLG